MTICGCGSARVYGCSSQSMPFAFPLNVLGNITEFDTKKNVISIFQDSHVSIFYFQYFQKVHKKYIQLSLYIKKYKRYPGINAQVEPPNLET